MEEAFNIKIEVGGKEVTLTILKKRNYYKVIYFGGILGAVCKKHNKWNLLSTELIEAGDLPLYDHQTNDERIEIILDQSKTNDIGREIDLYIK